MHKRLNWQFIVEFIAKMVLLFVLARMLLSYLFPVLLITYNSKYKTTIYEYFLNETSSLFSSYINEEDEEQVSLNSILIKNITGIDFQNVKSIIISSIPVMSQIEHQILASKEDSPIVVIPRISEDDEKSGGIENEGKQNVSNNDGVNVVEKNKSNIPKKRNLDPKKPLVLIYHTHTTESYNPDGKGKNFTTDSDKNMIRIGEELKKELEEKYGIATIHDTTYHDVPKREGAYSKSRPTIQKYLKQYNSFKIIIDLHRDANVPKNKTTAIISEDKYARIMFVVDILNKNHTRNNILVTKINDRFNYLYPGFSRGIMYKKSKLHYNQDLSPKTILIEVGSNANTLQEAINSSKIIARVLADCID